MSATKIIREITNVYYVPSKDFQKKVMSYTKTCYLCQLYNPNVTKHNVQQLPDINAPRQSWSIDIITDTPTSKNGSTQILVCVDDFSSFVIAIPIVSASSTNIIKALKDHVFAPFGIPILIRSDEQASIYNSAEFFQFLQNLGIQLTATAVASPFSNARAESQIKNIKHLMRKYLFQENNLENWDEELPILTSIHNRTIGIYGYAPEEIIFGNKNPTKIDLLQITEPTTTIPEYIEHILEKAEQARKNARAHMASKQKSNQTFKNQNRTLKNFELGSLVLHKQMQVSTGTSSKWKPIFKGPYVIIKLNDDKCTAIIEHLQDKSLVKAHFTNLQLLEWNPETIRFKTAFDDQLKELLPTTSKTSKPKKVQIQDTHTVIQT
jgi:transposase InsO family protein